MHKVKSMVKDYNSSLMGICILANTSKAPLKDMANTIGTAGLSIEGYFCQE